MSYFNLDLMERDAQRRLAKTIDASVKVHLAEFAKLCEPKPEPIPKPIYHPSMNVYFAMQNRSFVLDGFSPWNNAGSFGGMGGYL
jgi:hypothetical protein